MKDFAVALVIVSQRRPRELERCLAALSYQSLINFEIIVVADRAPLVSRFLHTPVRFIEFTDGNISKARNIGVEAAGAPIIAFCDDDAVPDPFWLERLVEPFYLHDDVGGATGFVRGRNGISYQWQAVAFNRSGQDIAFDPPSLSETTILDPHPNFFYKCIGTNCAFRRDVLHALGGFDHGYHYYLDDTDLSKRLSEAGHKSALVPNAQVIHSYRPSRGRGANRVPQSLYDLGASTHHFLRRHNPRHSDYHLQKFFRDQSARLRHFFHYGMVDSRDINGLLRDLRKGIEAGGQRRSITPLPKIKAQTLIALELRRFDAILRSHRKFDHDGAGILISLRLWPTAHAAKLSFNRGGYWWLRMGRFGRLKREGRFWRYRKRTDAASEAAAFLAPHFGKIDIQD